MADDGRGGADPANGSGLRGLKDRIAALDGTLDRREPRGRRNAGAGGAGDRRPSRGGARRRARRSVPAILRLRRRRGLVTHAAIFGVFRLAITVIWAAAGFGPFWPGWTIFARGVVLALHASLAILRQPITDSAVFRATSR